MEFQLGKDMLSEVAGQYYAMCVDPLARGPTLLTSAARADLRRLLTAPALVCRSWASAFKLATDRVRRQMHQSYTLIIDHDSHYINQLRQFEIVYWLQDVYCVRFQAIAGAFTVKVDLNISEYGPQDTYIVFSVVDNLSNAAPEDGKYWHEGFTANSTYTNIENAVEKQIYLAGVLKFIYVIPLLGALLPVNTAGICEEFALGRKYYIQIKKYMLSNFIDFIDSIIKGNR
jgi:hypothetical protein